MKSSLAAVPLLFTLACSNVAQQAPLAHRGDAACRTAQPAVRGADDAAMHGVQPVFWVLPPADRLELDAWCAAVGPAVQVAAAPVRVAAPWGYGVGGGPNPAGGHDALDSLLVVSWNVHVGGGDVRGFVRDLRQGRLTGAPVTDFVLLLQEAWRGGTAVPPPLPGRSVAGRIAVEPPAGERSSIDMLASELGLHLLYVPSMRNGSAVSDPPEDRGNAILSTLPLQAPVALELPVERQRRVAAAATVQGTTTRGRDWSLQLVTVHLENRAAVEADGVLGVTGVAARGRQARWLLDNLPAAELSVLAGDLNTWVAEEHERAAQKVLARYPDTPAQPGGATHVSHGIFRGRLDYIFGRVAGGSVARYARAPVSYGSDHYPLHAWILLP